MYEACRPSKDLDMEARIFHTLLRHFTVAAEAVVSAWTCGPIEATEGEVADLMCSLIFRELCELIEPLCCKGSIPWLDAAKTQTSGFEREGASDAGTMRTCPDGTRVKLS